jgi:hypothetical protein
VAASDFCFLLAFRGARHVLIKGHWFSAVRKRPQRMRWGQFNSVGTKGYPLRELSLGYLCENIAKPALGPAPNSAPIIIMPVNMMIGMPHVRAMVHRGRWLDWIRRLL